jgi:hypothetical protein
VARPVASTVTCGLPAVCPTGERVSGSDQLPEDAMAGRAVRNKAATIVAPMNTLETTIPNSFRINKFKSKFTLVH